MTTIHRAAALALLLTGVLALAPPQDSKHDDPSDREFRRSQLQRTVRENCLVCHSEEMIGSQRLTPKQWKAEVEKMVGWGTPVPPEQQQPLIDFLSSEYPSDAPPARLDRMTYREAAEQVAPDAMDGVAFHGDSQRGEPAYAKNCANCHGNDGQGADLGPNLVEKPVLWKKADYRKVVREGRGRMPGFASAMNESTGDEVLAWLRSRRYRPVIAAKK